MNKEDKKDKLEHYYWFRKMPYDEEIIWDEIEIDKSKKLKKKRNINKFLNDTVGYYYRELNTQFNDMGPIKDKYWYLRVPCPREIRNMYKKIACQEGKCAFFLACYKRK
jgi:hypothetical protein